MADRSNSNRGARPRWVFPKGAFADEDLGWLGTAPASTATGLQPDPNRDTGPVLRAVPVREVDPGRGGRAAAGDGLAMLAALSASPTAPSPAPHTDKAAEVPGWSSLIGRNASGEVYRVWTYGFEFKVGDAQYFDPGDARRIRLRPLLSSDRRSSAGALAPNVPWADTDANGLLVVDSPDGAASTVFLVTLFPRGDPEDPATVERAIEYVRREYGAACPAEMMLLG